MAPHPRLRGQVRGDIKDCHAEAIEFDNDTTRISWWSAEWIRKRYESAKVCFGDKTTGRKYLRHYHNPIFCGKKSSENNLKISY